MQEVRVLLTDCQLLFKGCAYLALSGEEGYQIIAEASNNDEAIDCAEKTHPDVIILNLRDDEIAAIEITHRLKRNLPSLAIILIVDPPQADKDEGQLFAALKSGANACLSKAVTPSELLDTIEKVVRGEYPIVQNIFKPSIASRIIGEFEISSQSRGKADNLPISLLPLEIEILQRIVNGNPIEQIARDLAITDDTVTQRLYVILGKLAAYHRHRR